MGTGIKSFWLFGYSPLRTREIRSYRAGVESCWRHVAFGLYVRVRAVYIPSQIEEVLRSIRDRGTQVQMWVEQSRDDK